MILKQLRKIVFSNAKAVILRQQDPYIFTNRPRPVLTSYPQKTDSTRTSPLTTKSKELGRETRKTRTWNDVVCRLLTEILSGGSSWSNKIRPVSVWIV